MKAYFLPGELFFLAILLFSYFGTIMHWRKWRVPTLILGLVASTALLRPIGISPNKVSLCISKTM